MSVYTLTTQRNGRIHRTTFILCLAIVVLFSSTTVYMVTTILRYQADTIAYFLDSSDVIWSYSMPINSLGVPPELADYQGLFEARRLHGCTSAATLAVNVVLGDAIVCWRACVVWQKNRVVTVLCGFFLAVTFAAGCYDATFGCCSGPLSVGNVRDIMFGHQLFGSVAYGISLGTNLLATSLVAFKAWQSRRRLGRYLVVKVGGSQVEKLMALLIESGVIYSVILTVVLVYQVIDFKDHEEPMSLSAKDIRFLNRFVVVVIGAFVPAIAIYPTIIIVLVALNKSHMERSLTQNLESFPTPHLALTVNTMATSLRESHVHGRLEVPVKDIEEVRPLAGGDVLESEAMRRGMREEETVEGTAYRHN